MDNYGRNDNRYLQNRYYHNICVNNNLGINSHEFN